MCGLGKYPYPPHGRSLEILSGEFKRKELQWERYGYFLEPHNRCLISQVKDLSELFHIKATDTKISENYIIQNYR